MTLFQIIIQLVFINIRGESVLYTETMILLAMRQKKWEHAAKILTLSDGVYFKNLGSSVENAVRCAKQGDAAAEYLLKVYSEVKWEKLNRK